MVLPEASQLAQQAAGKAHVAKNAFYGDFALASLAEAIERLAQAVTEIAKDLTPGVEPAAKV